MTDQRRTRRTAFATALATALATAPTTALAAAVAVAALAALAPLAGCERGSYDPLAAAAAARSPQSGNLEAGIPPQCYASTAGGANGCWTCHAVGVGPNTLSDVDLQRELSFSDFARQNRWSNLFADAPAEARSVSDAEILGYVREDNYGPLRRALRTLGDRGGYPGFVPDLDFAAGLDEAGFARDGSGWRSVRYKPFPGAFWPTNGGSAGEVYVRLPARFRVDSAGQPSREIYQLNLAILEAAVASPEPLPIGGDAQASLQGAAGQGGVVAGGVVVGDGGDGGEVKGREVKGREVKGREVEPVSEILAGFDLDGDGRLSAAVTRIRRLPARYAGGAAEVRVRRLLYPQGAELLHPVRYLDPDAPTLAARRMKELRYARKTDELDDWALTRAYEREADEKDEGKMPVFVGAPEVGMRNPFGWQLQGFIEDAEGRLRLQTEEEHRFCMGCHGNLGVTVDQTFALARKVPGAAGWRAQDLRGMPDAPQAGHADPEGLVYLRRAGGGDDFRANAEMLARFFPGGALDEREVRRAAPGGDRDLAHLVAPSRERALLLDKAYRALVRTQRFDLGRDPPLGPVDRALRATEGGSTGLTEAERVYLDGKAHLAW